MVTNTFRTSNMQIQSQDQRLLTLFLDKDNRRTFKDVIRWGLPPPQGSWTPGRSKQQPSPTIFCLAQIRSKFCGQAGILATDVGLDLDFCSKIWNPRRRANDCLYKSSSWNDNFLRFLCYPVHRLSDATPFVTLVTETYVDTVWNLSQLLSPFWILNGYVSEKQNM